MKFWHMYGSKFTKYLHGTWSLLNILMIFDIKDKSIILTHTMFFFFAIATNISQRLKTGFESESKSDVTYGQVWWSILWIHALHLTHPKCTHTPWTHTRSSGQPFMLRRQGRKRWTFTPPPTIPAGPRLEPATFRLWVRLSNSQLKLFECV